MREKAEIMPPAVATRHARADVPADEDEFTEWLVDRWLEMDDWIHDQLHTGTHAPVS